jgi:hypothetical protein
VTDPSGLAHNWVAIPFIKVDWANSTPPVSPALQVSGATTTTTLVVAPAQTTPTLSLESSGTGSTVTVWPPLLEAAGTKVFSLTPGVPANSGASITIGTALSADEQASAQVIPTQPYLSIHGTLNAAFPQRLYELLPSGDSRMREVGIEVAPEATTEPPVEMTLVDAAGNPIADAAPGPEPRSVSMNFAMDSASSSSEVFVKIAAPPGTFDSGSQSSGPTSESFVLQVTRGPEPSPPSSVALLQGLTPPVRLGDGSSSTAALVSQTGPDAGGRPVGAPAEDVQAELLLGGASIVVSAPVGGQPPLSSPPVATGPLPGRAGAPLGGVLAEGDPVPQVDRHDPALVDLALIGLPEPEAPAGVGEADVEALIAERERAPEEPERSLGLGGPRGLPVLTVSVEGQRIVDAETLLAALPPACASAAVVTPAPAPAAITAQTDRALEMEALSRPRRIAPASVLPGLTAAMGVVFGLILPDMSRLMATPPASRFRLRFRFRLRRPR